MYFFWDKDNDELEILGEDGMFHMYGEDSVAIKNGDPRGRYWLELEPRTDITPLNSDKRYLFMDPKTGEWVEWDQVDLKTFRLVGKLAGVKRWWEMG